jgi:haloalkane dehalogenase
VNVASKLLSNPPLRQLVVHSDQFVERFVQLGTARKLSPAELGHYHDAQATPQLRVGAAAFPAQLPAARSFFAALERAVPERLGDMPALITWGMKDWGVPAKTELPRARSAFSDRVVVELPRASHFIQEDVPAEIAEAITRGFGLLLVVERQQSHVAVDRLGAVRGVELAVDVGHVGFDGPFGDDESLGDLLVGRAVHE